MVRKALLLLLIVFMVSPLSAGADTVTLGAIGDVTTWPGTPYRWWDIADNEYGATYQSSFDYSQPTVTLAYDAAASTFTGTLTAAGLKPNFAYQMKLVGTPRVDDWANEQIGYAGRWWRQQPNPGNTNDADYAANKNDPAYIFQGYLLFDFFVTDDQGNATVSFAADSSYHVLWKTAQRSPTINDGPVTTTAFDPAIGAFYDTNYDPATVGIYAEWQTGRALPGQLVLPAGDYTCQFILTEESFHSTSDLGGYWAGAMGGDVEFTVVPLPSTVCLMAAGLIGLLGVRRARHE